MSLSSFSDDALFSYDIMNFCENKISARINEAKTLKLHEKLKKK